jgi:hypothetical protein
MSGRARIPVPHKRRAGSRTGAAPSFLAARRGIDFTIEIVLTPASPILCRKKKPLNDQQVKLRRNSCG